MGQRAKSLTWYVNQIEPKPEAICLQAASPRRLRQFILKAREHYVIERPFPLDAFGAPIDGYRRQSLIRSLQRHSNPESIRAAARAMSLQAEVEVMLDQICDLHGVDIAVMDGIGRSPADRRARIQAAHDLTNKLKLQPAEVAAVLNYKHHAGVGYLLRQPYPTLTSEVPDEPEVSDAAA